MEAIDLNKRLIEIKVELDSLPKAKYGSHLGSTKWGLYSESRRIRMTLAKMKGSHTESEFAAAFPIMACDYCGDTSRPSKDHKIPISKGGSHRLDNIRILCVKCNARKGGRIA